ncbi:hypothetical protein HMPREF9135_0263 [Segatella baroniae F0067]|uniref:Uncharacterized protein n=1 Tax=Segatella baroniae F0067 TaxID=1115809 RepID=U2P6M9_9BACT|nr:hypothetical protein HMPREF9135_0263 [Segatella baroniae F0067]
MGACTILTDCKHPSKIESHKKYLMIVSKQMPVGTLSSEALRPFHRLSLGVKKNPISRETGFYIFKLLLQTRLHRLEEWTNQVVPTCCQSRELP